MAYVTRRRGAGAVDEGGEPVLDDRPTVGDHAANGFGGLLRLIARLVSFVFGVIVLLIVAAIVLRLLGANPSNSVVHDVHTAGYHLVGPFRTLFTIHHPKLAMVVNWGIGALVWSLVGGAIARALYALAPLPRTTVAAEAL